MRQPRILGKGRSFYHCMSRVVDGRFIFGRQEKEFFLRTMRKLERFLEVRVVTYSLMSNHFHLLLEVPGGEDGGGGPGSGGARAPLSAEALLGKLPLLYDEAYVRKAREELERAAASGSEAWQEEILERYQARMRNLSVFVKELKQRFTQWYNRRHNRRGTLWEERFKSVLVEGREEALLIMAAYIDLNAVRAGLVSDPKDYRWCGYAEALGGARVARAGLCRILEAAHGAPEGQRLGWKRTAARYRVLLFLRGEESSGAPEGRGRKAGFSAAQVSGELAREGQLSVAEALRCRVGYFCDGAVLGTGRFVTEVLQSNGHRLGLKGKARARAMRGADWGDLRVMRGSRRRAIEPSGPSPVALSNPG